jgi:UDP-N-acetylglucosamine 2-epimerase (non-hydrolysing)/GDP/UDP-N,N'-diacetylbacillosamine 2-epimerase (hydrolysing)
MLKRKVCVVTGSRAEYGLLSGLLKDLQADSELDLQLIVTGMHLSPKFGSTYKLIEEDGFLIDQKVDLGIDGDNAKDIAQSMGRGTVGFAEAFSQLQPDILLVLGDRYEILSAVQVAMIMGIAIAHLHGGELTEGAIDDSIRHAITKMSHLHFVAAEPYRERVIQLGEKPDRIFNVGSPGLDNIKKIKLLKREEFEKAIDFKLGPINFLITYHPVTLNQEGSEQAMLALFKAIDEFPSARVIFTMPNSDADNKIICKMINGYVKNNSSRAKSFLSLGQLRYLSAIENVNIVLGNSSSGLIEVPVFKKPTVNIGDRQKGRLRASSVIDCKEEHKAISQAINKALSENFQKTLRQVHHPYKSGNASKAIIEVLKSFKLDGVLAKEFCDLKR